MLEWFTIVILIAAGLGLLLVELIFVPGTTIVGISGGLLVTFGVIQAFNEYGQSVGYAVFFLTIIMAAAITVWGFRSRSWERFTLKSSIDSKVNEDEIMDLQVGQRGITLSSCRPMGKAEFDNRNWEVRTNGGYLEAGTEVQIIRIENRSITIEPLI